MFYQSISQVYDYIFPKNIKQLDFIDKISPISENDKILDIGCATGNLTELLYSKCKNVTGIDLDEDLLSIAKGKSDNQIIYRHMDMLKTNENFGNKSIDKIISFGNTLVHLPNRDDVKNYFSSVYKTLAENGTFMVQIINYDRIINQNINHLPTVDNDHVKFIRDYVYHNEGGFVDFKTELTIKNNNQIIKNNIPLLTLTKEELKSYLENVGFENIRFYGDLEHKELKESSIPLLFSCSK